MSNFWGSLQIFVDGIHDWIPMPDKICFDNPDSWKKYVLSKRMEMTCGEAPYLASRYDATTGTFFEDVNKRIGLLDRKLRVISENVSEGKTDKTDSWVRWALKAYQSIYAFEWQGDNLLLARETLLATYLDFYFARWGKYPNVVALKKIAEIISWNIWQMDGLKYGIPGYDPKERIGDMYFTEEIKPEEKYCRIMEWKSYEPLSGIVIIFEQMVKAQ